jgi:hypothetical protein
MMNLLKRLSVLSVVTVALLSCNKQEIMEEPLSVPSFSILTDQAALSDRVHYINEPIYFENSKKSDEYTLVASIESPVINGQKLSASSVCGTYGRTYVGFHARGNAIGGELLSLDVTNPEEPVILQSAQSEEYEVNDVCFSQYSSKLWICGDSKTEGTHQAYAMEFSLDANQAHSETANWTKLSASYSGNSITETWMDGEVHLWFTSGSTGGLEVFPSSNYQEVVLGFDAQNTKHFDADDMHGVVVIGIENNLSIVRVYDFNNNFNYSDFEIPYTLNTSGKNGICIDRNLVYIAMGSDGLLIMNILTGEIVNSFKVSGGTANSVFIEKDYIYLAYGSSGLFIIDKTNMETIGNYKYEGSCNYVFVDHEMIYLANGDGEGFLILSKN